MTNPEYPNILVVDHTSINADLINDIFNKQQINISFKLIQSIPDLLVRLEQKTWQAIILLIDNIPVSIEALIEAMPELNSNCPIIVINQTYDRHTALEYIESGASNVFSLDEIEHLSNFLKQVLSQNQLSNTIQQQQQALTESHNRLTTLSNQTPIALAFIHDGAFININPAFQRFFSITNLEEVSEISFLDLIANEDVEKMKTALQKYNNDPALDNTIIKSINIKKSADNICPANLLISQTRINNESSLQVMFQPVEWDIKTNAPTANQNQLSSAESFIQSLNQIIRKKHRNKAYSLCFFELDGYSQIKNNIGITRSDDLLEKISEFMLEQASDQIHISRLNSDVYTLLVNADTASGCIGKIQALQTTFNSHAFNSTDLSIKVLSNIGVVHITDLIHTPDQALSLADVACTVSRNQKQNQAHVYNPTEDRSTVEHVDQDWSEKIRDALKHDNFKLLYQPIVSLGADNEKLYEVLLRIKRSGSDDIMPSQFLHFARQSKLESEIDKWVIRHAVEVLEQNKIEPIRFFINLSESSLRHIHFIEWLQENYDSQISNLVFEIPEDIALKWQPETLHFIQQIKKIDGAICIDQFGNHPEKTSQITALHADYHKVDGAFVSNLSTNRKHQSIVHKICQETQHSSTKTIATYVQDADSLAILWREGFDFIQGNYLQPPAAHLNYNFEGQI